MKLLSKIMLTALVITVGSGLTFATATQAGMRSDHATRSSSVTFKSADKNGDGLIDVQEAAKVPGISVAAADSNYDGVLDKSEWIAAGGKTG